MIASTELLTERADNPRLYPAAAALRRIEDLRALAKLIQEARRIRELEACLMEAQRFTKYHKHEAWFERADRALRLRP